MKTNEIFSKIKNKILGSSHMFQWKKPFSSTKCITLICKVDKVLKIRQIRTTCHISQTNTAANPNVFWYRLCGMHPKKSAQIIFLQHFWEEVLVNKCNKYTIWCNSFPESASELCLICLHIEKLSTLKILNTIWMNFTRIVCQPHSSTNKNCKNLISTASGLCTTIYDCKIIT